MNDSPRVLLILPCCNEEKSIGPLLQEIQALHQGYATIVIDDGSRDNTATVARRLSPVVRLSCNLGIGGSIQGLNMSRWTRQAKKGLRALVSITRDKVPATWEMGKRSIRRILSGREESGRSSGRDD